MDPVRPQQVSSLEDSSVIIKLKILGEALVLEPDIDDLGSPASVPVSLCYWED